MRTGDGQLGVVVVKQAAPEYTCIHFEVVAAQAIFSGNLSQAGRIEKKLMFGVDHQRPGLFRKLVRLAGGPD